MKKIINFVCNYVNLLTEIILNTVNVAQDSLYFTIQRAAIQTGARNTGSNNSGVIPYRRNSR
jgi:hypothetical protein